MIKPAQAPKKGTRLVAIFNGTEIPMARKTHELVFAEPCQHPSTLQLANPLVSATTRSATLSPQYKAQPTQKEFLLRIVSNGDKPTAYGSAKFATHSGGRSFEAKFFAEFIGDAASSFTKKMTMHSSHRPTKTGQGKRNSLSAFRESQAWGLPDRIEVPVETITDDVSSRLGGSPHEGPAALAYHLSGRSRV